MIKLQSDVKPPWPSDKWRANRKVNVRILRRDEVTSCPNRLRKIKVSHSTLVQTTHPRFCIELHHIVTACHPGRKSRRARAKGASAKHREMSSAFIQLKSFLHELA